MLAEGRLYPALTAQAYDTCYFTPAKVVYAISLKSGKALTTKDLFTFAQVSLLQAARALRAQGIDVTAIGIHSVTAARAPWG